MESGAVDIGVVAGPSGNWVVTVSSVGTSCVDRAMGEALVTMSFGLSVVWVARPEVDEVGRNLLKMLSNSFSELVAEFPILIAVGIPNEAVAIVPVSLVNSPCDGKSICVVFVSAES